MFGQPTRGIERYYLVQVADVTVHAENQLDHEREVYRHQRWWPLAEIRASNDTFFPEGLADLLGSLLAGRIPAEPIDISPERD
jgi:hypothetical protein